MGDNDLVYKDTVEYIEQISESDDFDDHLEESKKPQVGSFLNFV